MTQHGNLQLQEGKKIQMDDKYMGNYKTLIVYLCTDIYVDKLFLL